MVGNAASTHKWAAQISRSTGYRAPLSEEKSRKLDNVLLHRVWGPLLFLVVVIAVFEVVFAIGQPMMKVMMASRGASSSQLRRLIQFPFIIGCPGGV